MTDSVPEPQPSHSPSGDLGFDLPAPARVSGAKAAVFTLIAVGVLGAAFLAAYLPRRSQAKELAAAAEATKQALPVVAVLKPKLVSNERGLVLPGSAQPLEEAAIYAQANGYVKRWLVDLGAKVAAGDLLAEIDVPEIEQQLSQARADHARAVASKAQAEASRGLAGSRFQRTKRLVEAGVASEQELEQTAAESEVGDANVNLAEAGVKAESANVRRLDELRQFAKVTAPFAGTITQRNIDRGSLVTAGSASPLFRLAATQTLRVVVQVPQDAAAGVSVGVPATVRVREFPGQEFAGQVSHTSGVLDANTRTLTTEVRIDNREGKLLSGMYSEVVMKLSSPRKIFELPATALLSDARGLRIAIAINGKLHLQPITIDRDLGASLLISGGLEGTEDVVQIASANFEEGERVKVIAAKLPPTLPGGTASASASAGTSTAPPAAAQPAPTASPKP